MRNNSTSLDFFGYALFSNLIIPELGVSNPPRICKSVDFPDPEAPVIATNSPFASSKSRSFNTRMFPNDLVIPFAFNKLDIDFKSRDEFREFISTFAE